MKKYVIIGNGENTHTVKWVRALTRYFEVYLISSKSTHEAIAGLLPPNRIYNLNLRISGHGGNYQLLFKYRKVKKIIGLLQPDYVNAHYITSHGFIAALIKRFSRLPFRLVQSAWGSDILVTPFKNRLYRQITRFALNQADLVTSDSSYMTGVINRLSEAQTMTFSFGLESLPEPAEKEKEDYLFFSNRMLSDNYNIDEIIHFFSRVAAARKEARLIISHSGPLQESLQSQVESLNLSDRVLFAGFVDERVQIDYYRKARFYITIPTSDATSVSLLEAMAHGCIPIVSDIPANHEWIEEDINGIYYQKGVSGPEEIERALKNRVGIAEKNREIIRARAIFPDSIRQFVERIGQLNKND